MQSSDAESFNQEAVMENVNENQTEAGRAPSPSQFAPPPIPPKHYVATDSRYKSPVLATILSLMPGLGQIYVGYYRQGFINIIVVAGIIALLSSNGLSHNLEPFFGFFLAFYWLFNLVDAYRKSPFYNQSLAGMGAFELPEDEKLLGSRGSLLGGVLLIAVGAIALSYTRFGVSLDWVEDWWPLAPILMGAYLLYQPIVDMIKKRKR